MQAHKYKFIEAVNKEERHPELGWRRKKWATSSGFDSFTGCETQISHLKTSDRVFLHVEPLLNLTVHTRRMKDWSFV